MPLSKLQAEILGVIAAGRSPEDYVAGATPLNRDAARFSSDIDLFHDREERVAAAAERDSQLLEAAGYEVTWLRRLPSICTAEIAKDGASTRLEWVADSDYRFFPTMRDEMFGYILHPVDLATNKVAAAYGLDELQRLDDRIVVLRVVVPLGALEFEDRDGFARLPIPRLDGVGMNDSILPHVILTGLG